MRLDDSIMQTYPYICYPRFVNTVNWNNNIKSLNYDEESMELVPVTFGHRLGFIL